MCSQFNNIIDYNVSYRCYKSKITVKYKLKQKKLNIENSQEGRILCLI